MSAERSPFAQLRFDRGRAYQIEKTPTGVHAGHRDGGGWITANSEEMLRKLIADDYRKRPVSRETAR